MHQKPIDGCAEDTYDGIPYAGRPASVFLAREPALKPPGPAYFPPYNTSTKPAISQPYETVHEQSHSPSPASASTQSFSQPCSKARSLPYSNANPPRIVSSQAGLSSLHTEKASLRPPSPAKGSKKGMPDAEKAPYDRRSLRSCPSSNTHSHHTTIIYEDDDEDESNDPKKHAVWILPIRTYITRSLTPPLQFQLGLIYTIYETIDAPPPSSIPMLVLISVFSPLAALGVSTAAWIAASFWFFTVILGNPDGKDDKNDGKEAVMGVRRFWEGWLIRGLR
ncbi:MAG: hypothetical protein Q9217_006389 [Psora testacea]